MALSSPEPVPLTETTGTQFETVWLNLTSQRAVKFRFTPVAPLPRSSVLQSVATEANSFVAGVPGSPFAPVAPAAPAAPAGPAGPAGPCRPLRPRRPRRDETVLFEMSTFWIDPFLICGLPTLLFG